MNYHMLKVYAITKKVLFQQHSHDMLNYHGEE